MRPEAVRSPAVEMVVDPASALRPHFEELAGNLLSAGRGAGRTINSVVVTCPEPGAGCSSVCLGLGAALAGMGRPAAVVDCNLERPHLHRMLETSNFVGLTSSSEGGKLLENAGLEVAPGLLVVPTGPRPLDPRGYLESGAFVEAVRGLEESREMVVLDAPVAERVLDSYTLSEEFGGVLLVIHASRTSRSTARAVTDDLLESGVNLLGVVLNGVV